MVAAVEGTPVVATVVGRRPTPVAAFGAARPIGLAAKLVPRVGAAVVVVDVVVVVVAGFIIPALVVRGVFANREDPTPVVAAVRAGVEVVLVFAPNREGPLTDVLVRFEAVFVISDAGGFNVAVPAFAPGRPVARPPGLFPANREVGCVFKVLDESPVVAVGLENRLLVVPDVPEVRPVPAPPKFENNPPVVPDPPESKEFPVVGLFKPVLAPKRFI